MKHVIRAIILIVILYIIVNHYKDNDAVVNITGVLLILAFMYLVAGVIGAIRRAVVARRRKDMSVEPETKSSGCSTLLLIILLLALSYIFREPLGTNSFRAFHFVDDLLQFSTNVSAVIFWGILGLLVGSIYGSFVAWKKYKLNATVNLIPIGVLALFIVILYLINKPSDSAAFNNISNTQTIYAYNLVTAEVYNAIPGNNTAYKPAYLLDSSDKTAWITDISKSNPELRFSFKGLESYANKEAACTGFIIKNGYRKSPQLWNNFARVKGLSIKHNGRFITAAIINDKNTDSEEVKIAPVSISSFDNISITVNSVYPGEKYPTRVAITELVPVVRYKKY